MFSICHYKSLLVMLVNLFLLLTVGSFSLHAEVQQIKGKPPLPGEECQTDPREIWTQQEKWVWEQVCLGKIADFNKIEDYGGSLNPKEDKEWPEIRILRPVFLETILLHEPYLGALPRGGVRIMGAWFKEPFSLTYATLSHTLWLDRSRFESEVNFFKLKTFGFLSIEGSVFKEKVNLSHTKIFEGLNMIGCKFTGKLNMGSMQADQLRMDGGAQFAEVDLPNANIGGLVAMDGSKFTGNLNMSGIQADHLLMGGKAEFAEVDLHNADIERQVSMIGSKFTGNLNMSGIQADHLLMSEAEFAEVDLHSADIERQVSMIGSKFTGNLNMNGMHVEGHLLMSKGANFGKPVTLIFSKIGKNLGLYGSTLAGLDLTGAHVGGEFALGPPATQWSKGAKLILRNTEVKVLHLQNFPKAWPDKLDLTGFTYAFLGGRASERANDMADKELFWFKEWLEKQGKYSPQPYEQLAKILRNEGRPEMAKELLYAGKNRELSEAEGLSWLWLALLWVFIGYGYRIHWAIYWFLGCWVVGVLVLKKSSQGSAHGMPFGIAYSLDMLLPIIRLRECHYDFDLEGWARYYFYLHKLMGYILVSFLIAGLSGLTK